jgi:hypothetical protein
MGARLQLKYRQAKENLCRHGGGGVSGGRFPFRMSQAI